MNRQSRAVSYKFSLLGRRVDKNMIHYWDQGKSVDFQIFYSEQRNELHRKWGRRQVYKERMGMKKRWWLSGCAIAEFPQGQYKLTTALYISDPQAKMLPKPSPVLIEMGFKTRVGLILGERWGSCCWMSLRRQDWCHSWSLSIKWTWDVDVAKDSHGL